MSNLQCQTNKQIMCQTYNRTSSFSVKPLGTCCLLQQGCRPCSDRVVFSKSGPREDMIEQWYGPILTAIQANCLQPYHLHTLILKASQRAANSLEVQGSQSDKKCQRWGYGSSACVANKVVAVEHAGYCQLFGLQRLEQGVTRQ